jgi:hypothetical protein
MDNTDSLLFSKTNLSQNHPMERKAKKKSENERILEEHIIRLKKEKPIWLKKSILEEIKKEGGNIDSTYILKVG